MNINLKIRQRRLNRFNSNPLPANSVQAEAASAPSAGYYY
jgi:hypothetical protein